MRTTVAGALVLALLGGTSSAPTSGAGSALRQESGTLWGSAVTAAWSPLSAHTIQLRHIRTGQLAGSTTSDANGHFRFVGVPTGSYLVELLKAEGHVIGTTTRIVLASGVTISVVVVAAADGTLAAAGPRLLSPVAGAVIASATALGVTAVIATRAAASPSR